MFARAASATIIGIDAHEVIVESNPGKGLPGMALIGLARGAVKESLIRVRAAILASGIKVSGHRLVVNLLPAELPKEASALDLALAAAILASVAELPPEALVGRRFYGELSLGGGLEPVRGAVLAADLARRAADRELLVSAANAAEAAVIPGVRIVGVESLTQMVLYLKGEIDLGAATGEPAAPSDVDPRYPRYPCISEVRGQQRAKRALEVAAAGGHNILMVGPPGSGKTMLARCLPGLLPDLGPEERIEVTRIHSAAGLLTSARPGLVATRPFRAPHHTASEPALCGGGSIPRPGEITLAHRGVLFLDELPEFSRRSLEALREPLEEGQIHIARAAQSLVFPARVLLVAAMNPCPCGRYRGDLPRSQRAAARGGPCLCAFDQVQRYRSRISGPLLDRIDMHVVVDTIPYREYARAGSGEPSPVIRGRVVAARDVQSRRLGGCRTNATMNQTELRSTTRLDETTAARLEGTIDAYGLSARAISRILEVARTIADLRGSDTITGANIDEAVGFRLLDRAPAPVEHAA